VNENERNFARVQLGVHRNSDEAAPPAGEQLLDVGGAVARDEDDALTPAELEPVAKTLRDRGGPARERGVIGDDVHSDDDSGAACPRKEFGDVHVSRPSSAALSLCFRAALAPGSGIDLCL
jgi:hypothetical protein